MDKIWIFDENKRQVRLVDRDRCRESPHAPSGKIRYCARRNSDNWEYCAYGDTREQCVERANTYVNREIAELKKQLAAAEARLIL